MEITNVRARKVISDAFFYLQIMTEIQKLILLHDSM